MVASRDHAKDQSDCISDEISSKKNTHKCGTKNHINVEHVCFIGKQHDAIFWCKVVEREMQNQGVVCETFENKKNAPVSYKMTVKHFVLDFLWVSQSEQAVYSSAF